jgi:hypothetical protein
VTETGTPISRMPYPVLLTLGGRLSIRGGRDEKERGRLGINKINIGTDQNSKTE